MKVLLFHISMALYWREMLPVKSIRSIMSTGDTSIFTVSSCVRCHPDSEVSDLVVLTQQLADILDALHLLFLITHHAERACTVKIVSPLPK